MGGLVILGLVIFGGSVIFREHFFKGAVGSYDAMSEFCQKLKLKRRQNVCHSKELLNTG